MWTQRPFISGKTPNQQFPLSRYLPPFKAGVFSAWASDTLEPGAAILDPFGISPRLALELAGAGFKVISVCSNPVTRFVLRMAASNVQEEDLVAALALLAGSRVGDQRLEPYLKDIYQTTCPDCGTRTQAEFFVWQKEPLEVVSKKVVCSSCTFDGIAEVTPEDKSKAEKYAADKLTHARALSKIAPTSDPDRPTVENALGQYLPRALFVMFTTINRFDSLTLPQEKRDQIVILLLSALYYGNTLWGYPTSLERPKQLVTPPQFMEFNLWKVMEKAVGEWAGLNAEIPVYDLRKEQPVETDGPGIWVFPGRFKDIARIEGQLAPDCQVTVLPRPAPAYWTLSAMWGSWLWGKESLGGFRSVIRRQRFEWAWHTAALSSTFSEIGQMENLKDLPMFAVGYESEPAFDLSICVSADVAGRKISSVALNPELKELQIQMEVAAEQKPPPDHWAERKIAEAGKAFLKQAGMPMKYNRLQLAGILGLMEENSLGREGRNPTQQFYDMRDLVEASYSYKQGFIRYGGSEKSNEVGHWWLADETGVEESILDQMEQQLVNELLKQKSMSTNDLETHMNTEFPGLVLPQKDDLAVVLDSYGENPGGSGWQIKEVDAPANRRSDLELMRDLINHLGSRLGYTTVEGTPFIWMDKNDELAFSFHIIASALIDKIVFNAHFEPGKSVIVLPGSRSNLVARKLERNPRLKQKIREGWHFIKFRRVRWLAENPTVNQHNFLELIGQDQLTYSPPQERLL